MSHLSPMKCIGRCLRRSSAHKWYDRGMRAQVSVFLLVGFVVGFAGVYTWEKQRAPAIVRATPVPVAPNVPADVSAGKSASEPQPPPRYLERVKELTSKLKQDPTDFESIVELGSTTCTQKTSADA